MSANPQQQTNEWCRIFRPQLQTWISAIKLVEKYKTSNWSLRQGDGEVNKRIKQNNICLILFCFILLFTSSSPCRVRMNWPFYIYPNQESIKGFAAWCNFLSFICFSFMFLNTFISTYYFNSTFAVQLIFSVFCNLVEKAHVV